jgi:hypothetical protein
MDQISYDVAGEVATRVIAGRAMCRNRRSACSGVELSSATETANVSLASKGFYDGLVILT